MYPEESRRGRALQGAAATRRNCREKTGGQRRQSERGDARAANRGSRREGRRRPEGSWQEKAEERPLTKPGRLPGVSPGWVRRRRPWPPTCSEGEWWAGQPLTFQTVFASFLALAFTTTPQGWLVSIFSLPKLEAGPPCVCVCVRGGGGLTVILYDNAHKPQATAAPISPKL